MYNDIHKARTLAFGVGRGWGVEDVAPYGFADIPFASGRGVVAGRPEVAPYGFADIPFVSGRDVVGEQQKKQGGALLLEDMNLRWEGIGKCVLQFWKL